MTEMGLVFANRTQTATQYSKSTYGHKYAHHAADKMNNMLHSIVGPGV